MRASVNTPVSHPGAHVAHFPRCDRLPLNIGRSTLTIAVSRPAQRSLRVPARMVAELLYVARLNPNASYTLVTSIIR